MKYKWWLFIVLFTISNTASFLGEVKAGNLSTTIVLSTAAMGDITRKNPDKKAISKLNQGLKNSSNKPAYISNKAEKYRKAKAVAIGAKDEKRKVTHYLVDPKTVNDINSKQSLEFYPSNITTPKQKPTHKGSLDDILLVMALEPTTKTQADDPKQVTQPILFGTTGRVAWIGEREVYLTAAHVLEFYDAGEKKQLIQFGVDIPQEVISDAKKLKKSSSIMPVYEKIKEYSASPLLETLSRKLRPSELDRLKIHAEYVKKYNLVSNPPQNWAIVYRVEKDIARDVGVIFVNRSKMVGVTNPLNPAKVGDAFGLVRIGTRYPLANDTLHSYLPPIWKKNNLSGIYKRFGDKSTQMSLTQLGIRNNLLLNLAAKQEGINPKYLYVTNISGTSGFSGTNNYLKGPDTKISEIMGIWSMGTSKLTTVVNHESPNALFTGAPAIREAFREFLQKKE